MGTLTRLKGLALCGCLLFASQAYSLEYIWSAGGGRSATSPSMVCDIVGQAYSDNPKYTRSTLRTMDVGVKECTTYAQYTGANVDQIMGTLYIFRYGDTCPPNTAPYDDDTGICPSSKPPPKPGEMCEDQTGATAQNPFIWDASSNKCEKFFDAGKEASCKHMGSSAGNTPAAYTVAGNISSTGQAVAPPSFTGTSLNCTVKTVSSSECTINVEGAVSCNVMGTFTGDVNNGGTANAADALCPNGVCPVKEMKTETSEEKCAPAGNGSGGSSCTESKKTSADGKQQCGTVNGGYQCITKKPSSNGINTSITATSQTLPDGSIKVTTVKDSSLTACTDVKTCTTTTSQTTQHSTTSPSGGTKTDTSCKGTCTASGGGVETLPNAGTGTGGGTGNGNGDGEGEGSGGTASTSDTCAAPPPCDGDPFQCAILQQAHIDTCKLMAPADDATKAEWDAKIAQANADADAHQSTMDSQVNTLLSGFQSSTGGGGAGGGKCLPDVPVAVMGHTVTMEFSKTCDSISFIRMALLAMAYLVAARIVFKEV